MVFWQEEAYTRTDEDGNPVSFVRPSRPQGNLRSRWTLIEVFQEAYKEREQKLGGRWQCMTKSDVQLYSITGSDLSEYLRKIQFADITTAWDSFWTPMIYS